MYELATFIVRENSIHHCSTFGETTDFFDEVDQIYNEDLLLYEISVFYVATLNERIIGSLKITLWDGMAILPIEKLFGIRPNQLIELHKIQSIWHVGRFAISKNNNTGLSLLKQLLTLAIYNICRHSNSIMLAECDKKLLKVLNLIGIKTKVLAPGIEYLGSETIPIYAIDEWLSVILNNNPYLHEISEYPCNDHLMAASINPYC